MIRGFYTALSGVIASANRLDLVADDIANVNTPGYKASDAVPTDFEITLANSLSGEIGTLGTGTYAVGPTMDRSQGVLESTTLPTDLAIEGDGLFAIQTPDGVAYTRAGNFVIDANGMLVTQAGHPVLATDGGTIVLPAGAQGLGIAADGVVAGTGRQIALVPWPTDEVTRLGGNLLALPAGAAGLGGPQATGRIRQGALERSNTDLATGMTDLMRLQRSVSMASRALTIQERTIDDAITVGRLR